MIEIFKGDDSDWADLNEITVRIRTELNLTGFTGKFCFLGVEKQFTTAEIASKTMHFTYTEQETKTFALGRNHGTFFLFDTEERPAAVQKILVNVLPHRDCAGEEPSAVTIDIENVYDYNLIGNRPKIGGVTLEGNKTLDELGIQAKLVSGTNIKTINNQTLLGSGNITIEGGGVKNYDLLDNRPQINGHVLTGNQTHAQLGINIPTQLSEMQDDASHRLVNDSEKQAIADNTSARHGHANKGVLDNTTASFTTEQADAISGNTSARHTHTNKTLLDTIPVDGTTGYVLKKTDNGATWEAESGGTVTDVQVDSTSVVKSGVANIVTTNLVKKTGETAQSVDGAISATGRITGAKVKVPTTADLEIGDSATLASELAAVGGWEKSTVRVYYNKKEVPTACEELYLRRFLFAGESTILYKSGRIYYCEWNDDDTYSWQLDTTVDLSGKQDNLSDAQLAACNSGITSTKVSQHDAKLDKVTPTAEGNIATLNSDGTLADSQKKVTDFDTSGAADTAVSNHDADDSAHSAAISVHNSDASAHPTLLQSVNKVWNSAKTNYHDCEGDLYIKADNEWVAVQDGTAYSCYTFKKFLTSSGRYVWDCDYFGDNDIFRISSNGNGEWTIQEIGDGEVVDSDSYTPTEGESATLLQFPDGGIPPFLTANGWTFSKRTAMTDHFYKFNSFARKSQFVVTDEDPSTFETDVFYFITEEE